MTAPTGIRFVEVTKRYGDQVALADATFEIPPATATALIGPNGAGKSTAVKLILGLIRPTSGAVLIDGIPAHEIASRARIVGAATEGIGLDDSLSGRALLRGLAGLVGVSRERADEVLERVGAGAYANQRVGTLSVGMRQRIALATALLPRSPYLVLDEPQTGLDPDGMAWLYELLRDEIAGGRTILLATHHLGEVDDLCEHCIVLGGTVRYAGPADTKLSELYEAVR